MHRDDDPLTDGLKKVGVHIEPREATVMQQMLASGVGGIIGSAVGAALGLGLIGRGLTSLGGSIAGHLAVTHRVTYDPPRRFVDGEPRPEGPAPWSDRR